jgi:signal transduction histidine kinase
MRLGLDNFYRRRSDSEVESLTAYFAKTRLDFSDGASPFSSKERKGATPAMLSAPTLEGATARYAAALGATGIALIVRLLLNPVLGDDLPYITLFGAVAFSAWFCGAGPSIAAVAGAIVGARYWLLLPKHTFGLPDTAQSLGLLAFLFVSSIIIALGEMNRRTAEKLRCTREELEAKVKQRTAELDAANKDLRDLTGHVLHLQDDERRRIARELHDSAGQSLAALAMNLSRMETEAQAQIERLTNTVATAADSTAMVKELISNIRTISYLLHPPMLDEAGLTPALRWLVQGFSERSQIAVELDLPDDLGRLPQEFETTIFRVVQECLANILRHSESRVATIRLLRSADDVQVEVRDSGKGIPSPKLSEMALSRTLGVGIRGMRERVSQLGGTLQINSDGPGTGTAVTTRLPIAISAAVDALPRR